MGVAGSGQTSLAVVLPKKVRLKPVIGDIDIHVAITVPVGGGYAIRGAGGRNERSLPAECSVCIVEPDLIGLIATEVARLKCTDVEVQVGVAVDVDPGRGVRFAGQSTESLNQRKILAAIAVVKFTHVGHEVVDSAVLVVITKQAISDRVGLNLQGILTGWPGPLVLHDMKAITQIEVAVLVVINPGRTPRGKGKGTDGGISCIEKIAAGGHGRGHHKAARYEEGGQARD